MGLLIMRLYTLLNGLGMPYRYLAMFEAAPRQMEQEYIRECTAGPFTGKRNSQHVGGATCIPYTGLVAGDTDTSN